MVSEFGNHDGCLSLCSFLSLFVLLTIRALICASETVDFVFLMHLCATKAMHVSCRKKENQRKYLRAISQLIRNGISKMERAPPPQFRIRVQGARYLCQSIRAAAAAVAECGQVARLRDRFQTVFCAAGCGCVTTATETKMAGFI